MRCLQNLPDESGHAVITHISNLHATMAKRYGFTKLPKTMPYTRICDLWYILYVEHVCHIKEYICIYIYILYQMFEIAKTCQRCQSIGGSLILPMLFLRTTNFDGAWYTSHAASPSWWFHNSPLFRSNLVPFSISPVLDHVLLAQQVASIGKCHKASKRAQRQLTKHIFCSALRLGPKPKDKHGSFFSSKHLGTRVFSPLHECPCHIGAGVPLLLPLNSLNCKELTVPYTVVEFKGVHVSRVFWLQRKF